MLEENSIIDLKAEATITKVSDTEIEVSKIVTETISLNNIEDRIEEKKNNIQYLSSEKTKIEGSLNQINDEIAKVNSDIDELLVLKAEAEKQGVVKE